VYSTFLGGFGVDGGTSIAVDSGGNAYVTGFTTLDFPVTSNAFQSKNAGGQDGFIIKLNADDIKTNVPVSFPMNGGTSIMTAGQTAQPVFGYASVEVSAGASPSGLAIIDLRSGGTLLSEVSLPVPVPSPVGQLYVSTIPSSATAITMVNRNSEQSQVDVEFIPNGGGTPIMRSIFLAAHAQLSGFLYADPFNFPINLEGSFTYFADTHVSTIALRAGSGGGRKRVSADHRLWPGQYEPGYDSAICGWRWLVRGDLPG
jgi:hypothetical protein